MDDIYFAITALVDTGRISEAFHMMRGLFGIAGMEWPQEIKQLEKSEELQDAFVSEFIFDFYDVIEERRADVKGIYLHSLMIRSYLAVSMNSWPLPKPKPEIFCS